MSTALLSTLPQTQPFMYLDDPPSPPHHPWDPPSQVPGFSVPYRLRFLLPCIDAVHLSTLNFIDLLRFQRHRIYPHFRIIPSSEREDYTADALYMDDEEQDTYIRQLQQEDILKNENYAKLFTYITVLPLPFFLIRFWIRPSLLDFTCALSLILSALSIPAPYTNTLALRSSGPKMIALLRTNLYMAAAIALHCSFFPPGEYTWRLQGSEDFWMSDIVVLGVMPFVVAVFAHVARRLMEAVNYLDMGALRYRYLEPERWEMLGREAAKEEAELAGF